MSADALSRSQCGWRVHDDLELDGRQSAAAELASVVGQLEYVTRVFETLRGTANTGIAVANVERIERGEQPLLPEMTLHGLRHMHASLLLASGADIALASKRLGRSSISITSDLCTHLIGDAARRAAEGSSARSASECTTRAQRACPGRA
ncbi:integrase [Microbacterium testaceum StLB037]|uniref:Integrase n=1 Tax=Microbacterium testaceum (strain StLB037) TaxID=979556 RepID=E8N8Y4_MICTS|nr:tyrosine-type recombinase/integrase [Microbacterium testaceum]BAJ73193.1 integrase [Microbacterium testaceum StLB037]